MVLWLNHWKEMDCVSAATRFSSPWLDSLLFCLGLNVLGAGIELMSRLGQGSCSMGEVEESGGEECRGESGGELRKGEGINYKVDTFNKGLESNPLPGGIGKQQLQSTIPILDPRSSDKDCLSQSALRPREEVKERNCCACVLKQYLFLCTDGWRTKEKT